MSVYIIKEDITTRDGALLLCKDQIVNDDVLRKLKRFNSSISIDSQNFEIYNETEYNKSYDDNEKASSAEIIQSFGARKKYS